MKHHIRFNNSAHALEWITIIACVGIFLIITGVIPNLTQALLSLISIQLLGPLFAVVTIGFWLYIALKKEET